MSSQNLVLDTKLTSNGLDSQNKSITKVSSESLKGRTVYDITNADSLNSAIDSNFNKLNATKATARKYLLATVLLVIAVALIILFVAGPASLIALPLAAVAFYTGVKAYSLSKQADKENKQFEDVKSKKIAMTQPDYREFAKRFDQKMDEGQLIQVVSLFQKHEKISKAGKPDLKTAAEMDKEVRKLRTTIRRESNELDGKVQITALINVDIQEDFTKKSKFHGTPQQGTDGKGALYVTGGEELIPIVKKINETFEGPKFWTKDWHPKGHCSFGSTHNKPAFSPDGAGGLYWPDHCVQNSDGAKICAEFNLDEDKMKNNIINKGTNLGVDSYSGLYDNDKIGATDLDDKLWEAGVTQVEVCGLAYDYCVGSTADDAASLGYSTRVLKYASRSVAPDSEKAMDARLDKAHVKIVDTEPKTVTIAETIG